MEPLGQTKVMQIHQEETTYEIYYLAAQLNKLQITLFPLGNDNIYHHYSISHDNTRGSKVKFRGILEFLTEFDFNVLKVKTEENIA